MLHVWKLFLLSGRNFTPPWPMQIKSAITLSKFRKKGFIALKLKFKVFSTCIDITCVRRAISFKIITFLLMSKYFKKIIDFRFLPINLLWSTINIIDRQCHVKVHYFYKQFDFSLFWTKKKVCRLKE